MRLAFVHPFLFRYARGIERYTVNLASALAAGKDEVDILTWHWPDPLHWSELAPQVGVQIIPTARCFAAWFAAPFIARHLLRNACDMVYIHFADYGEARALRLLKLMRRQPPFSIVLHYPYSQVPHRYHSFIRSGLARQARQVIAVSQFVADEAQPVLGRSCAVISHGVDIARFHPDPLQRASVRHRLDIPEDAPLLLTISAFEERKGMQWLIRALPDVARQFPTVRYLIVGEGPYGPELRRLTQELGLQQQVHFHPATPDVTPFYQAADLFVILARGEASSLVSLEALACELPVLAAAHPPFGELIRPAWGRQVDETDSQAIISTLSEVLRDRDQHRTMGRQGRAYILAEHTWPAIARQYQDLLS
jgi:phosphatidylinositol alpha-1,6-mannosyltransferase